MNIGKLINYQYEAGTLSLQYENKTFFIQQMMDGVIRFSSIKDQPSVAVIKENLPDNNWGISESNGNLTISINGNESTRTANLELIVKDNFLIDIYEDSVLVCSDYTNNIKASEGLSEEELHLLSLEGHKADENAKSASYRITKALFADDAIYGLGDKPGCLNRRGYIYENWNTDDPSPHVDTFRSLYKSIPFFIVAGKTSCYGIFADNTYRTTFDFGKECNDYYYFQHEDGELDYYYISGKEMSDVVSRYVDLTGHNPIPQKWILGYHQSRWSYRTEKEVLDLVNNFKKYEIPCDCVHLDIDYMDGFRVFTFNNENFPDPKKLTDTLSKEGVKIISIIDPGVKKDEEYFVYKNGIAMDAFIHDKDDNVYENAVWPGTSVFPDFTREDVRAWWGENLKLMVDYGVRGIWNDMNEPASFNGPLPNDVKFSAGTHDKIHNIYGHLMAQATFDGLKKYDNNRRPFILTRACYGGSQRYCGGWTGDNHSIWSHIQLAMLQMCSLGISGMSMCGSDIGGFGSDTTKELFIRFFEAAIFSPFFRSHSAIGTKNQEPWCFDDETTVIIRKIIKLRYRFIPYIYDLSYEAMNTGAPILRPLVYEYTYDKNVRNLADEYLLGSNVLVAPIIEPGKTARAVYLPEGKWYDLANSQWYDGGKHILAEVPLDHIPIYIKAGSIIPLCDKDVLSVDEITSKDITIYAFKGVGKHTHYCDDSESLDYENGIYKATVYNQTEDGQITSTIIHDGYICDEPAIKFIQ